MMLCTPLGILLGPTVTDRRQFANGLLGSLVHLAIQSLQCGLLPLLALGGTASFATWLRLLGGLLRSFLTANNRGGIQAEVTDHLMRQLFCYQRIMHHIARVASEKEASDGKEPAGPNPHILRRLTVDSRARCRSLVFG